MKSPYQNFINGIGGNMMLDLFITRENSKLAQKISFTDEEFDELVEFLEDMFPPKIEGGSFTFNVEADCDYEIKEVKDEKNIF